MSEIIRKQDTFLSNVWVRHVHGLNIFSANGIKVSAHEDPRLVVLKDFADAHTSSIHIGSIGLKDLVDSPEELFGPSTGSDNYFKVGAGVKEGIYYFDVHDDSNCFFPIASDNFWEVPMSVDDAGELQYLIECGSIALYSGFTDAVTSEGRRLLNDSTVWATNPLPSQAEWVQRLTEVWNVVVVTGHDGTELVVYTRSPDQLDLLSLSIKKASDLIAESSWYKQNQYALTWDSENEKCLILTV